MTKHELYDLGSLTEMVGEGEGLQKMVAVFVESTPKTLAELNENFRAKNYEMLAKNAHKMKASLDMMKIGSLYDVIRQIDKPEKIDLNLNELGVIVARINEVVDEVIGDLKVNYSL